jgi:septation ring formation regulator EzrA
MTPKRKATSERRAAKPTNGPDGTGVVLEDIYAQMKVVIEAVQDCATKRDLAELREVVDRRFDAIDDRFEAVDRRFDAVDDRFEAVDRRFEAVDDHFEAVHQELRALRHDATLHAQSGELRALEQRVLLLEQRTGG